MRIAIPFQSIAAQIDEIRCHGWDTPPRQLIEYAEQD